MSFLPGRVAVKEAAYFIQESKQAVSRMLERNPQLKSAAYKLQPTNVAGPDVLPGVLRHSIPSKLLYQPPLSDYSPPVSSSTKWSIHSADSKFSRASPDAIYPLRGYVSLPQFVFGPRRCHFPKPGGKLTPSTANELRSDHDMPANAEKLKAAAEGLKHIGKAFAFSTAIVFGSAALTFGLAASQLEVQNGNDLKFKGRDLLQPKVENFKERLAPLRNWVDEVSRKWHLEIEQDGKVRRIIKEHSKRLKARSSE